MARPPCVRHPERPGTADCRGCRAAVCTACAVVTPQGSWCSAECAVVHKALQAKPAEDPLLRRAGWAGRIAAVLLLGLLVLIGVHLAASRGLRAAKAVDVLGRFFEGLGNLKVRGTER
jgi:hypothetical protein